MWYIIQDINVRWVRNVSFELAVGGVTGADDDLLPRKEAIITGRLPVRLISFLKTEIVDSLRMQLSNVEFSASFIAPESSLHFRSSFPCSAWERTLDHIAVRVG